MLLPVAWGPTRTVRSPNETSASVIGPKLFSLKRIAMDRPLRGGVYGLWPRSYTWRYVEPFACSTRTYADVMPGITEADPRSWVRAHAEEAVSGG